MKNVLTKTKYVVAVEFSKSPSEVFKQLVDLRKWWPEDYVGEKLELNKAFVLKIGDGHFSRNKVIEFTPNKKLTWLTTESFRSTDDFDWSGTKMIFELTPKDRGTSLTFTYDGVVFENERARLAEICDFCVKNKLYNVTESFTATIELAKSPEEVFRCIVEVTKWWSNDFEGASENPNDEFIIHHPGQHYSKQKLVEVVPGKKMIWQVTESNLHWLEIDQQEWTNTKMIFEIATRDDKTILHFTHQGLTPEKECYTNCEKGWGVVIKNWLPHFITHGAPSPEMNKADQLRDQLLADTRKSK
ncbi:MAG TPA: SRPBCC domain-containing protein [Cyclobacteriaceae bacterium]|jgi:uncharacterized protein YndB with AHSA1/START domain|nr:SRPBCC domain-containing protein [Cyclobacteriaceae bacterium]